MGNWIPNIQCFPEIKTSKNLYSLVIFITNNKYFHDEDCKNVKFLLSQINVNTISQFHFITKKKHRESLEKLAKNEIKDAPITFSHIDKTNVVEAIISLKKKITTSFFFINANKSCFVLSDFLKNQANFLSYKNIIYVEKLNNFFFHSLNIEELNIISANDEKRLTKITLNKNVMRDNIVDFKNTFAANHLFFFQLGLIECIEKIVDQKKIQDLFLEKKENSRLYDILEYINNINMEKIYVSEK